MVPELNEAPEASAVTSWDQAMLDALPWLAIATDLGGTIRAVCPRALQKLGFSANEIIGRASPLLFHDLEQIQQRAKLLSAELGKSVRPGLDALTSKAFRDGRDMFDCNYVCKNGTPFPVYMQITLLHSAEGDIRGVLYTAMDKRDERPAAPRPEPPQENDFRDFLDNSSDMVQSLAPDGHFLYVNRSWLRALEYEVDDLPQLTLVDIIHPDHIAQTAALFKQALTGNNHSRQELVLISRKGRKVIVESSNTFAMENGRLTAIKSIFHDITSRKHQEQILAEQQRQLSNANVKLALLATTDALTGLKNRRVFDERMDYECERAIRQKTPLALIILDVDHFKEYNDNFGHPAGDVVLQQLSTLLLKQTRTIDCVVRYGGEEFAIILPNTPLEGAHILAERCRQVIEGHEWPERMVTASLGVASVVPTEPTAITRLLAMADSALYRAKMEGRNRVSCAPAPTAG